MNTYSTVWLILYLYDVVYCNLHIPQHFIFIQVLLYPKIDVSNVSATAPNCDIVLYVLYIIRAEDFILWFIHIL